MRGLENTGVLGVGLQLGVGQLGVGYLGVRGESLDTDGLSLDLQFATDKTLTARKGPTPTFTRASTATFVGSDGLIQSAAVNAARFDHDPVTLACKGLLIEESRTNLLSYSEDMTVTNGWAVESGNSQWVNNAAMSPNLAYTAEKLQELATTSRKITIKAPSVVTGTSYTFSVYAKAGERNVLQLATAAGFDTIYQNFDLSTGAVGGGTATNPVITPAGNGWYRCSVTVVANATGVGTLTVGIVLGVNDARFFSYIGVAGNGLFLWGAQLEVGSSPTSYIPTVASTVVRSADVCSITGSDFTGFYNQSEGSFACNYSITSGFTGNRYAASIEDTVGGTLNGFVLRNTNAATSFIAGAGYSSIIGAVTTTVSKHILAYSGLTEFVYVKDSVVGTTTGSGTRDPSLPIRMSIGTIEGNNTFTLCGHISAIRYFKKRLPNAKLQTLTT